MIPYDTSLLSRKISRAYPFGLLINTKEADKAYSPSGSDIELDQPSEISNYNTKPSSAARHSSAQRLHTAIASERMRPSAIVANEEHATTDIAPARVGHITFGFDDMVFLPKRPKNKEIIETRKFRIPWIRMKKSAIVI